jgi:hypothetical protein
VGYWNLEPEVAGGLGEGTIMDRHAHPPIVSRLHYALQSWLGDELLTAFPCHIVTQRVREALAHLGATGCAFDEVHITTEYPFDELYPGRRLPPFTWLKISGRAGLDDFGLSADHRLVISSRVLRCLREFQLAHCEIEEVVG